MHKIKKVGILVVLLSIVISGCAGENTNSEIESMQSISDENNAYFESQSQLESLDEINTQISDVLLEKGYTLEHATEIQEILNTVGITSIDIENMTGQPEEGLNSVVCYPNEYTEQDRKFWFTTENGVLFYAGFANEDLYDSQNGGYLKNYNDVHIPEKEVTWEVYDELRTLAAEEVKACLNYPNSADFGTLDWRVGRNDDKYQIIGSVMAQNALGVAKEINFSVWFKLNGEQFLTEGVALDGVRVK